MKIAFFGTFLLSGIVILNSSQVAASGRPSGPPSGKTSRVATTSESALTQVSPASGSASGGTGVIVSGTGLTGVTSITFGGVAATSVNVVDDATVTAVTPGNTMVEPVDVTITTANGNVVLSKGYTYIPTAVGQYAYGGIIGCLNGGLNNLIVAVKDWGPNMWGPTNKKTFAMSDLDGAENTAKIVAALGDNGGVSYAAKICSDYEVDSQGNTPCKTGNTCYSDWFLPAMPARGNQQWESSQLVCLSYLHANISYQIDGNWSSTEADSDPTGRAAYLNSGLPGYESKDYMSGGLDPRVVCARNFTP